MGQGGIPEPSLPASFLFDEKFGVPTQLLDLMGGSFVSQIELLGRRTGELHKTLLSNSKNQDFAPEPFSYLSQFALAHSMMSSSKRVLQLAARVKIEKEDMRKELEVILANQGSVFEKFNSIRSQKIEAVKGRTHGDYHLGQVLFTGKDFVIIDFEGEPARSISERRIKRSPLRDVAGMIRSFQYAAYVGLFEKTIQNLDEIAHLKGWSDLWYKGCSKIFLSSYEKAVYDARIIPSDKDAYASLMSAFLLERALYELGYELSNRPGWVVIPIRGIRDLLGI